MNLKNNRGYVITDISIAIIILLVLIPVIMGMVYGINTSKHVTEIKTEAINIATNTIEAAKLLPMENDTPESFILNTVKTDIYDNKMTINENEPKAVIETDKASYMLEVNVIDYKEGKENDDSIEYNVVKTVTVTVTYKNRGEEKQIELSTVVK